MEIIAFAARFSLRTANSLRHSIRCATISIYEKTNARAPLTALHRCAEIQTCHSSRPLCFNPFAGDHDVKTFSHPGGSDQMFELQSDFRALLRQTAFLKGIRKLSRL